jgi:hypothetical protein
MLTLALVAAPLLLAVAAPRWGSDSRRFDPRSFGG